MQDVLILSSISCQFDEEVFGISLKSSDQRKMKYEQGFQSIAIL